MDGRSQDLAERADAGGLLIAASRPTTSLARTDLATVGDAESRERTDHMAGACHAQPRVAVCRLKAEDDLRCVVGGMSRRCNFHRMVCRHGILVWARHSPVVIHCANFGHLLSPQRLHAQLVFRLCRDRFARPVRSL